MTQHILAQDTEDDNLIMRCLRNVVVGVVFFTPLLALGVAYFAG